MKNIYYICMMNNCNLLYSKMYRLVLFFVSVFICYSCAGADKKEIKASEITKLLKKGEHVQIVDKIILDDVDFTKDISPFIVNANMLQCEIRSNIFFDNCIFMGKVTSNGKLGQTSIHACFKNNLVFSGCDFRGDVDFDRTIVFGMVNFSRSVFRENANFNNLAVWAKDSYFSEVKAEKDFSMIYASFAGNLYYMDAVFDGNVSFQESSIKGKFSFNNGVLKGKAGFDLMEICGAAFFNYTVFEKKADFSYTRFMHTAEFVNANFGEKGVFEKSSFFNTVRFDGVDTAHQLILTDTFFVNKILEK